MAAEINNFLCFIFVFLWSRSGWPESWSVSTKTCFGVWLWEGLSSECQVGLNLKRWHQMASTRFITLVGTRRRFGSLRVMSTRCASSKLQSRALREEVARERHMAPVAKSLVERCSTGKRTMARSIAWGSTRFGDGGGQLDHQQTRGVSNACAREGRFWGESWCVDHGLVTFCERTRKILGALFGDAQGFERLDAGSRASFVTSSRPPPLWTPVYFFPYFCMAGPWETFWSNLIRARCVRFAAGSACRG